MNETQTESAAQRPDAAHATATGTYLPLDCTVGTSDRPGPLGEADRESGVEHVPEDQAEAGGSESEYEGDPDEWLICPICGGDGHHSRHLGDFTMSEFNETFDDEDSRADYFAGAYDRACVPCSGTGKLRRRDLPKVAEENERDLIARTGRNSAGEPC